MGAATTIQTGISLSNILYCTDFTAACTAALPYLSALAMTYGATVHALHVRRPSPYWRMGPYGLAEMEETERELAEQEARKLNQALASMRHKVTVSEGDIWTLVSGIIKREHIDLVVVGTHGRSGLSKVVLGSVAAELFRRVPCPVLCVGPRTSLRGDRRTLLREILYATDFSSAAQAAAPYAYSLAQAYWTRLTLLTVLPPASNGDLIRDLDDAESANRRLNEIVPFEVAHWCKPEYLVRRGRPAQQILAVACERSVDMIVMGAKRLNGSPAMAARVSPATVQEVAGRAPCPVLIVKGAFQGEN
jgi:nucleotide-binding universal stress UspA family protein